jgi:hypothetical protein
MDRIFKVDIKIVFMIFVILDIFLCWLGNGSTILLHIIWIPSWLV